MNEILGGRKPVERAVERVGGVGIRAEDELYPPFAQKVTERCGRIDIL